MLITGSLKKVQGGALGLKPEVITGIPPKVNTERRVKEPPSLTVVSVYMGIIVLGHLMLSVIFRLCTVL